MFRRWRPRFSVLSPEQAEAWIPTRLLPLVFAFAKALVNLKAGFLGIRGGQRLEFGGGVEGGKDFAHRLFARRAMRQRFG